MDLKAERLNYFRAMIDKEGSKEMPPFSRWLGGVIREVKEGEFSVEFLIREEMTNPAGVLHGGIHAAILDEVIGMTVFALGKDFYYLSTNLSIDFLSSAKKGDKVVAKSRIIREGKQVINAIGELFDKQGKILSRASSNLVRTSLTP
ncbi:MAG: PaaI family thioesterase [Blastocatellia bacterium]|nr:PaaI family thioesterase [Blastocatellia bacterium]